MSLKIKESLLILKKKLDVNLEIIYTDLEMDDFEDTKALKDDFFNIIKKPVVKNINVLCDSEIAEIILYKKLLKDIVVENKEKELEKYRVIYNNVRYNTINMIEMAIIALNTMIKVKPLSIRDKRFFMAREKSILREESKKMNVYIVEHKKDIKQGEAALENFLDYVLKNKKWLGNEKYEILKNTIKNCIRELNKALKEMDIYFNMIKTKIDIDSDLRKSLKSIRLLKILQLSKVAMNEFEQKGNEFIEIMRKVLEFLQIEETKHINYSYRNKMSNYKSALEKYEKTIQDQPFPIKIKLKTYDRVIICLVEEDDRYKNLIERIKIRNPDLNLDNMVLMLEFSGKVSKLSPECLMHFLIKNGKKYNQEIELIMCHPSEIDLPEKYPLRIFAQDDSFKNYFFDYDDTVRDIKNFVCNNLKVKNDPEKWEICEVGNDFIRKCDDSEKPFDSIQISNENKIDAKFVFMETDNGPTINMDYVKDCIKNEIFEKICFCVRGNKCGLLTMITKDCPDGKIVWAVLEDHKIYLFEDFNSLVPTQKISLYKAEIDCVFNEYVNDGKTKNLAIKSDNTFFLFDSLNSNDWKNIVATGQISKKTAKNFQNEIKKDGSKNKLIEDWYLLVKQNLFGTPNEDIPIDKLILQLYKFKKDKENINKKEKERLENEKAILDEKKRMEKKEKLDKERLENEKAILDEKKRMEKKEMLDKGRLENERREHEVSKNMGNDHLYSELKEKMRNIENENKKKRNKPNMEIEILEKKILEKRIFEKMENERVENERVEKMEKKRVEMERMETERMETERMEKERMEKEKMEKEKMEKEKMEKEKMEKKKTEKEKMEKEIVDMEKTEKEKNGEKESKKQIVQKNPNVFKSMNKLVDNFSKRRKTIVSTCAISENTTIDDIKTLLKFEPTEDDKKLLKKQYEEEDKIFEKKTVEEKNAIIKNDNFYEFHVDVDVKLIDKTIENSNAKMWEKLGIINEIHQQHQCLSVLKLINYFIIKTPSILNKYKPLRVFSENVQNCKIFCILYMYFFHEEVEITKKDNFQNQDSRDSEISIARQNFQKMDAIKNHLDLFKKKNICLSSPNILQIANGSVKDSIFVVWDIIRLHFIKNITIKNITDWIKNQFKIYGIQCPLFFSLSSLISNTTLFVELINHLAVKHENNSNFICLPQNTNNISKKEYALYIHQKIEDMYGIPNILSIDFYIDRVSKYFDETSTFAYFIFIYDLFIKSNP